jgi:hypothetical protein
MSTMTHTRKHATRSQRPLSATAAAWLLLGLMTLLGGCAARTITLDGSYPAPLVARAPLTVGVYFPEALREFSYIEIDDDSGKDQYVIEAGASQLRLFNTLLPSMFERVVPLDAPTTTQPGIDAVFIPSIEEFQLGLPEKTRLKVYEVWLKYNMRLTQPDGEYIADWVMTAYGKSPTESFQSVDAGVKNAALVAMRDLAASFTLGFGDIPDVRDWLQRRENASTR